MSRGLLGVLLVICGCIASPLAAAEPIPLDFRPSVVHHTQLQSLGDGQYQITTTGIDSYLEFELPSLDDPAQTPMLAFDYFSPQGVVGIEVRVAAAAGWSPPIDAGSLGIAEGWVDAALPLAEPGNDAWNSKPMRRLRVDFGQQAGVMLRIRNWRLRPLTPDEQLGKAEALRRLKRKRQAAATIADYLREGAFASSVTEVRIDASDVTIQGRCDVPAADCWLAELDITTAAAFAGPRRRVARLDRQTCDADGNFQLVLPRFRAGRDRLTHRWQIVRYPGDGHDCVPLSTARYVTQLPQPAADLDPPPPLSSAKGLGGISPVFGLDEIVELGVRHITVNTVVTDLIEDTAIDGAESFRHEGRTWWIRPGRLNHVDQTVAFAADHGITVALIILLPTRSSDIIVHPEATSSGIYAMPNLDDAQAAAKYTAVLSMLAERYSGGDHGRVDHWIMHNEVDFGWIWTNMGEQPIEVYTEMYVRSMRLAHLQAQRFNPHSQVFISLTHHWNVPHDPRLRTYAPRAMLETLAALTAAEGDFRWGVAYHPYPQNLFNPRTWDDTRISDDFDTPLITMKNLQVLRRFLEQDAYRDAEGRLRPVLLSEQGYHTDGYGDDAQRLQGAALLYTWDRLRQTDFVLAYDYHRWVDAAEEGGLLLGLRTVPDAQHRAGQKKLGWEVYRAIGTEQESQWRQQLESIYRQAPAGKN